MAVECSQAVQQSSAASRVVIPVLPFGVVLPIATVGGLLAQIDTSGGESEGGEVDQSFEVEGGGDYAAQCAAPLQFGITGSPSPSPAWRRRCSRRRTGRRSP